MDNRSRILLVIEDKFGCQSLKTVLQFIGMQVDVNTFSDWQKQSSLDADYYLAIIVEANSKASSAIQKIAENSSDIPIILYNNSRFDPSTLKKNQQIVAEINSELTYGKMLEKLHMAQIYRSHCLKLNATEERTGDIQLFKRLVGCSRKIRQVRSLMVQVMNKDANILITGESGTGKEIVARNLHQHSSRGQNAFVPVNCAAIPPELLESELFGHERGAFTGAVAVRKGRFELANNGTLFLDEIGDMPLNMQVKLLRVLQEQRFERVGGNESIQVNTRIIAATHQNLEKMVAEGKFREDLYYRLNVFPIEMPPLRERLEDIPLILNDITTKMEQRQKSSVRFNSAAMFSLCKHPWHGNVRELVNLVERLAIMYPFGTIGIAELPDAFKHLTQEQMEKHGLLKEGVDFIQTTGTSLEELAVLPVNGIHLKEFLAHVEKKLIRQALSSCGNVVARAAKKLHIRRTTLVEKMRKYGLYRYASMVDNE